MDKQTKLVTLTEEQRSALEAICRQRKVDALVWMRARAFLLLDAMDSAGHCNSCSSLRAGVRNPKVFRGRLFRWFATLSKSCCE